MSLYLDKPAARRALRNVRKEAAGIASAASALSRSMKNFKGDTGLSGKAFTSAKNHFGDTYYAVLLLSIKAADELKTSAERYLKMLEQPYTLDRSIMDEAKLKRQRDRFQDLADGYNNKAADAKDPETKDYYENILSEFCIG